MSVFATTFSDALALLATFDHTVAEIVLLSLQVSGGAVVLGTLIGLPLGACIAVGRFPGKSTLSVLINGLMGLPRWLWAWWCTCFCLAPGRSGASACYTPRWR